MAVAEFRDQTSEFRHVTERVKIIYSAKFQNIISKLCQMTDISKTRK